MSEPKIVPWDMVQSAFNEREQHGVVDTMYSTGIPRLDELIDGGIPVQVPTAVGARPGVGKSQFAVNFCRQAVVPTILISLEDPWVKTAKRMRSNNENLDYTRTARYVEDVEQIILGEQYSVVVIDYLQLLRTRKGPQGDRERVAYITNTLSDAVAHTQAVGLVTIAQLKRPMQGAEDVLPTMDDFKGSGAIEERAKLALLLHRPDSPTYAKRMDIKIGKSNFTRQGEVRAFNFDGERGKIW